MSVHLSKTRAVSAYLVAALFLFFEMGVQVSPSVMTQDLMRDLGLNALGLGLMSGFYFYTYTGMQVPSGLLLDRAGERRVMTLAITVCALGCFLFAGANDLLVGSLARLLIGFGSAFAFVAVLVVTAEVFPAKQFALVTGITQMLAAFGAMAGQMPLSYLVLHMGWRWTMCVLGGVGLCLALCVWFALNYPKHATAGESTSETKKGWRRTELFLKSQTWWLALYALLLWAPMVGFASLWGVPFLTHVYGLTQQTAALLCSLMWLGLAFASPLLGWLSTTIGRRVLPLTLSAGLGVLAFGCLLFLHVQSLVWLAFWLFLAGAACSGQALSFTLVKENTLPHQRATAIAFNNMAVVVSGAIFQPILGRLLDFHCGQGGGLLACAAYHYRLSLGLMWLAYCVGALVSYFFIREPVSI